MTREEAIKIIRDNIPHLGIGATQMTKALESLVPELRESEDERIRKEIIDYLGLVGKGDGDYAQPMIDRWISYLEKQKEQKPNYCHHEVDETGWTEEYRKAYYDGWNNCNMQHEQLKADHKPAEWSKEDDLKLGALITDIETRSDLTEAIKIKYVSFLKSLRPSWKPSKEQILALHDAKNYLIAYCQPNIAKVLSELEELFKKL